MKALTVAAPRAAPQIGEIETPVPKTGEVRIRIEACGLNFADLLLIEGRYQDRPGFPLVPGMEVAGRIEAVGPEVSEVLIGARTAAVCGNGGLAEAVTVAAERCQTLPETMPPEVAAGFLIAYGTSHLALNHRASLRRDETLLVLGAGGGVGLTAVEIGRLMGARVLAAARGKAKCAAAKRAGAHEIINTETEDLKDTVKRIGGADVVYDPVGGDAFSAALSATRPEGRILLIGFASGDVPRIKANHLLVKNVSVHGINLGGYLSALPDRLTDSLRQLFAWWEDGQLQPTIGTVLPLDRAPEGLEMLRARRATGKIVVTP